MQYSLNKEINVFGYKVFESSNAIQYLQANSLKCFSKVLRNSVNNQLNDETQKPLFIPDLNKKTILIVDDENMNYIYLNAALKNTNALILHAINGIRAIEMVKKNPGISIILMDIKMPEMNGIEATRIIKSFNKDVIIIAQTAFAFEADREACMNAGCDDYLAKPISRNLLLETISKYI